MILYKKLVFGNLREEVLLIVTTLDLIVAYFWFRKNKDGFIRKKRGEENQ